MEEILPELERWQRDGEAIALATLVRVHRTAPRQPGARMLVTASGKLAGAVSGGCVEGDIAAHAAQVLASGRPRIASYGIADELGLTVGLTCGGSLDVLIEPFVADPPWTALVAALATRRPAALCTALAPDEILGRRLLLETVTGAGDGAGVPTTGRRAATPSTGIATTRTVGSIAADRDDALDDALAHAAGDLLAAGRSGEVTLPSAAGAVTVFVEIFPPQAHLIVVGATDTARHLARMATDVGFHVTVVDPRGAYATPERFPGVTLVDAWPDEALADVGLDAWTYVVTLTHDAKLDVPTLACALRSPARYVGAQGSRRTHEGRTATLRAQGIGDDDLARVHAPIGLDIGSRTAAEIAVSILAEILAVRAGVATRARAARAIHADSTA
jgi:xanthine dehydrogenase accessory factor